MNEAQEAFSRTRSRIDAPTLLPRPFSTAACGKAIIVGEHAAVYGARAVAMPVPAMRISVQLTPTSSFDKAGRPLIRVLLGGRSVSDHLLGVVHDAFATLRLPVYPLEIEACSTVLIGAGLGSSAALCIVILKALAGAAGLVLSASELAAAGNCLERRFHGNPSGLDTAVVASEQAIAFARDQAPEILAIHRIGSERRSWRFALLDSGARSSTLAMIQSAAPYFQGSAGAKRIAHFNQLANQVCSGLRSGQPDPVAEAMRSAAEHLEQAGVVSARLREVLAIAAGCGVLAAKPTGAGGGGCILALLNPEQADQQVAALKSQLGASRVFPVVLS